MSRRLFSPANKSISAPSCRAVIHLVLSASRTMFVFEVSDGVARMLPKNGSHDGRSIAMFPPRFMLQPGSSAPTPQSRPGGAPIGGGGGRLLLPALPGGGGGGGGGLSWRIAEPSIASRRAPGPCGGGGGGPPAAANRG